MTLAELSSIDAAPPHSVDAEVALLGSIFLDNAVMNEIASIVREPEQFYRTRHQLVYASMQRLSENGTEIDWITVKEDLNAHGQLEDAGNVDYLQELTEATPSSAGAEQYATVVRDKSVLRAIIASASEIRARAYDPTSKAEDLIDEFEREVFRLGAARFNSESRSVQDILQEVMQQIEYFQKLRTEVGAVPGLPSGFKELDQLTTGFKPGELMVMAARPGHGKTSLALNMADFVALSAAERRSDGKGGVAFFSLEMTGIELISRVLCSMAGVNLKKLRLGSITPAEERELKIAEERLAATPMFIDDSFILKMAEIRSKSRRLRERYGIELVVVDYLQLIHGDTRVDRHEQIGHITRGLKSLARELQIPVLALAQLNRSIEQRRGAHQRPMLSDLRESGSIEQDADIVMFIQRDRMLDATKREEAQQEADLHEGGEREQLLDVEPATLIVAKNRSGPVGDVRLMFRKSCTRFELADRAHMEHFGG